MRKIRGIGMLWMSVLCILFLTSCRDDNKAVKHASVEHEENVYEKIEAKDIRRVKISGNARSIIIKQDADTAFKFQNADLNAAHTYDVRSSRNGDTLNISVMMKNGEEDNDVLGSFLIYLPRKEFDVIETAGEFKQIHINPIHSDIFLHADKSVVALHLEAAKLDHDIVLDGSETNAFKSVSVYFDTVPASIKMEVNPILNGSIQDPQHILDNGRLVSGTEKPVIRIHAAKEINLYKENS